LFNNEYNTIIVYTIAMRAFTVQSVTNLYAEEFTKLGSGGLSKGG